ncbi:hypothetical protein [Amycolatopsis sp. NPDC049159]
MADLTRDARPAPETRSFVGGRFVASTSDETFPGAMPTVPAV